MSEREGSVLVPLEPTPEMLSAARWAMDRWREANGNPQGRCPPDEKHAIRWRAMVAAAMRASNAAPPHVEPFREKK